jgi:hypothetical protein
MATQLVQAWEYCHLTDAAVITYLQPDGRHRSDPRFASDDVDAAALHQAMAYLGQEGWELAAVPMHLTQYLPDTREPVQLSMEHEYLFKRQSV